MSSVGKSLGSILVESGRISDEDVERALEYQRVHGGFFGEALLALGLLRRDEIDWALARQFDLPYIFPNAKSVDPAVAALVSEDWALAHLAVPIVLAGDVLTVVVADPLQKQVVDDLRVRTGYDIELALASAARIRDLARMLYARVAPDVDRMPLAFGDLVDRALDSGAHRFGVSVRGPLAWGWYEMDGVQRRPLLEEWEDELNLAVRPGPATQSGAAGPVSWSATLSRNGVFRALDAQALHGAAGVEYLFRLIQGGEAEGLARVPALPGTVAAELRLLARSGSGRVAVAGSDAALARAVLPHLPALVFDGGVRAAHLADVLDVAVPGSTIVLEPTQSVLDVLEAYRFDAVSADISADGHALERVLAAAPLVFVHMQESDWRRRLPDLRIGWILDVTSDDRGLLTWKLLPANE